MYVAKISLKKSIQTNRLGEKDKLLEILNMFIIDLVNNASIPHIAYPLIDDGEYISFIANIFHKDALEPRFFNKYLHQWLETFANGDYVYHILNQDIEGNPISTPEQESAFILTTATGFVESPVIGMDSQNPIPLQFFPKTHDLADDYYNVRRWINNYQACDELQMGCAVGELWALAQMGDLNSELTQQGLEICKILQEKLQKPVYYNLYKYYITDNEENDKCPSCGSDWLLDKPLHDKYDFKCDKCHLLSNLGLNAPWADD